EPPPGRPGPSRLYRHSLGVFPPTTDRDLKCGCMAISRPAGSSGTPGDGRRWTPDGTEVVLTDTNPYGRRMLVGERDETSSVAYLCAPDGYVHGAVWLANHRPAPETVDRARLAAGLPPVLPGSATRHPLGRPPLGRLSVLWFEEGDGVALYEDESLLAVIP